VIHFRVIRFKNILSTGNAWTEIQLDGNKSTLIVGENGAGKSTMLDAISFALYGKAFRNITKPQLLNSINQKELMVEIEFSIARNNFMIRRGIKPNVFEIWKNGALLNQDAAARDYQSYLEDSILKLTYKSFGQVVVLGSSTFVPFMQLKAGERREVIEDLLDIQIFTVMNTLLKEKLSGNKESIQNIKYQIDLLKNRIDSAKEHNNSIRELKEGEVTKLKEKLREQIALIEAEQEAVNSLMDEVKALTESVADKPAVKKKLQELQDIDRELSNKHRLLTKDIAFFESHDDCPTCRQGIEHDFKEETINNSSAKAKEIFDAREKLSIRGVKIENRLSNISSVESDISRKNLDMSEHNANYKMAMTIDMSSIKLLEDELNGHHSSQTQLFDDKEMLGLVSSMLKDGGIKTRIIKQYVPVMNKLINKYLSAMDFFVQFELDENFNETIKSRFRDVFSYASFSEGEKLRIDLALLFTWRAVSKLRNSVSTNLLIMDEIMDSSLDNSGTEEFLKIINEITADSNIFIISHKGDQLYDKFDNVIRFEKVKNFSKMLS
jgi:DNA repair exonuclease SbcCD ATPase subunit